MPRLRNLHKIFDPEIRAKNLRALQYQLRGLYWDMRRPQGPDPIFIIGCSRSGTTVTYETFATSPLLLSLGYEIPEFWDSLWGPHHNDWASEAATAENATPEHRDAALRFYYQRLGTGRVLDKTSNNVMRLPYLYRLFPAAMFIYIHRDGRDNISSMMDGWRHDRHFCLEQFLGSSPEPVAINKGEFQEWSFFLPPGWRDYNQASLEEVCAWQWITANRLALEAKRVIPARQWIQLRYEDIFDHPVGMFESAFEKLGIPFDAAVRRHCENLTSRPTSIVSGLPARQKWRSRNPEAIKRILNRIEPLMRELGYESCN